MYTKTYYSDFEFFEKNKFRYLLNKKDILKVCEDTLIIYFQYKYLPIRIYIYSRYIIKSRGMKVNFYFILLIEYDGYPIYMYGLYFICM